MVSSCLVKLEISCTVIIPPNGECFQVSRFHVLILWRAILSEFTIEKEIDGI